MGSCAPHIHAALEIICHLCLMNVVIIYLFVTLGYYNLLNVTYDTTDTHRVIIKVYFLFILFFIVFCLWVDETNVYMEKCFCLIFTFKELNAKNTCHKKFKLISYMILLFLFTLKFAQKSLNLR